jgi:hypothetical protein
VSGKAHNPGTDSTAKGTRTGSVCLSRRSTRLPYARVQMHVVPSVGVQECAPQSRFDLKPSVRRDSTRCWVINGMADLEAVEAEVRECPACRHRAGVGRNPPTTKGWKHPSK